MSDELMELPEGWEWIRVGDIASVKGGKRLPKGSEYSKEPTPYPYIRVSDFKNNSIDLENIRYISQDIQRVISNYTISASDVYISIAGTIGVVGRVPSQLDGANLTENAAKISLIDGADPDYLCQILRSEIAQNQIHHLTIATTQPKLALFRIESLSIPLPPLNEQKRIVAAVESLRNRSQNARSALAAIPELCDKFRQSVLAAAFRGDLTADWREQNPDVEPASVLLKRIRLERRQQWEISEFEKFKASGKIPKDDSWKAKYKETTGKGSRQLVAEIKAQKYRITDLPEDWTVVKLGEIAQLQTGYAFKSSWFADEGVRLLRGTNIIPGETRWEEVVYLPKEQASEFEEYRLNDGDIVIAMDRPIISTGLKVARLSLSDTPSLLLQRVGRFKIGGDISSDFLLGFLNSQLFIAHVQDQATGTQLPHISANDIESAIIPLPPIAEQQEISKLLRVWMQKSSNFTDLVDRIFPAFERIDRSILAKAFQGELVEQDPNDEPASVLLERIRAEREQQTQGKAKKPGKKRQRTIKAE